MTVRGMINDYSQQRVLVTVLFISEIKRMARDPGEGVSSCRAQPKTEILNAESQRESLSLSAICDPIRSNQRYRVSRKLCPSSHQRSPFPCPPTFLGCGSPGGRSLWMSSSDVEDGANAQEEAPEDGPQLRDQVKLHHLTQVGVVAGRVRLELEQTGEHLAKDSDIKKKQPKKTSVFGKIYKMRGGC